MKWKMEPTTANSGTITKRRSSTGQKTAKGEDDETKLF